MRSGHFKRILKSMRMEHQSFARAAFALGHSRAVQSTQLSVNGNVRLNILELNVREGFFALAPVGGLYMRTFEVHARWDAEAGVWWAQSDDVPGLVAEATTHDALIAELKLLVPELLAMNLPSEAGKPGIIKVISEQVEDLCFA